MGLLVLTLPLLLVVVLARTADSSRRLEQAGSDPFSWAPQPKLHTIEAIHRYTNRSAPLDHYVHGWSWMLEPRRKPREAAGKEEEEEEDDDGSGSDEEEESGEDADEYGIDKVENFWAQGDPDDLSVEFRMLAYIVKEANLPACGETAPKKNFNIEEDIGVVGNVLGQDIFATKVDPLWYGHPNFDHDPEMKDFVKHDVCLLRLLCPSGKPLERGRFEEDENESHEQLAVGHGFEEAPEAGQELDERGDDGRHAQHGRHDHRQGEARQAGPANGEGGQERHGESQGVQEATRQENVRAVVRVHVSEFCKKWCRRVGISSCINYLRHCGPPIYTHRNSLKTFLQNKDDFCPYCSKCYSCCSPCHCKPCNCPRCPPPCRCPYCPPPVQCPVCPAPVQCPACPPPGPQCPPPPPPCPPPPTCPPPPPPPACPACEVCPPPPTCPPPVTDPAAELLGSVTKMMEMGFDEMSNCRPGAKVDRGPCPPTGTPVIKDDVLVRHAYTCCRVQSERKKENPAAPDNEVTNVTDGWWWWWMPSNAENGNNDDDTRVRTRGYIIRERTLCVCKAPSEAE
ncbi:unnamed protein product [Trichogramma brassicae]|uniref:Uncharacterized protein n=1 Tax=Trichogramma brassicae TaxID=86971 RepID=A0A6H5I5K9_9HYME|nr:unnamed protein product [Trichogramma brassicae]